MLRKDTMGGAQRRSEISLFDIPTYTRGPRTHIYNAQPRQFNYISQTVRGASVSFIVLC